MSEMDLIFNWFKKAKNDLICAIHLFEDLYPKQMEISCYHCQQSAEKALKGYLLYKGIETPKTHNLVLLCQLCEIVNTEFEEIMDDCSDLTPYAVQTRYPNEIEITECETTIALSKSKNVFEFTLKFIPELQNVISL
jgi:HEPN domain-containing protein